MKEKIFPLIVSLLVLVLVWRVSFAQETGGPPPGFPLREDKGPRVGDVAPPFKLKSLDGKEEFELEAFKGVRPVVLLFGSYT